MLRPATPGDAPALLRIYGQYIDTSVTFEYLLPSEEEFRARIEQISREYPYLVCERDGIVLGYAYAHRYKERAAYQWGAELSVYVDGGVHARGLGKRLYTALIELLRLQGVRTVYGCVTLPNDKSAALHESMGFTRAARLHSAGFKNGLWHDVVWYERSILPYDEPEPIRTIRDVDAAEVRRILERYDPI